jgi:protein-disulfide isomerase
MLDLRRAMVTIVGSLFLAWSPGMGPRPGIAGENPDTRRAVVAVVEGREITEQELNERVRGELLKLENQIYEVRRNAIDELIAEYLVERAAKAQGLTREQLLQRDVEAKVGEVAAQEIEDFYRANQARIRKPLEEIRPQIADYLRQTKLNDARRAYVKTLRETAQVKILLQPPIVPVSTEGAPFKGPKDAPITIVEFSDFQCPYCKRVIPILDQLMAQYAGQIKLVYRDFPISSIHPAAQRAAEAAHCAGEQGKFWEFHDVLYDKQADIPTMDFREQAAALGLDAAAFQACLEDGRHRQTVARHYADGLKAGVSGTPAFFINGRLLSGAQPLEAFKAVIDDELERLGLRAQR